jgi:hypothetical protein
LSGAQLHCEFRKLEHHAAAAWAQRRDNERPYSSLHSRKTQLKALRTRIPAASWRRCSGCSSPDSKIRFGTSAEPLNERLLQACSVLQPPASPSGAADCLRPAPAVPTAQVKRTHQRLSAPLFGDILCNLSSLPLPSRASRGSHRIRKRGHGCLPARHAAKLFLNIRCCRGLTRSSRSACTRYSITPRLRLAAAWRWSINGHFLRSIHLSSLPHHAW